MLKKLRTLGEKPRNILATKLADSSSSGRAKLTNHSESTNYFVLSLQPSWSAAKDIYVMFPQFVISCFFCVCEVTKIENFPFQVFLGFSLHITEMFVIHCRNG